MSHQINQWFSGLREAVSRLAQLYSALGDERQRCRCRKILDRLDKIDCESSKYRLPDSARIHEDDWASEQASIREAVRNATALMVFYTVGYECSEPGKRVIPRGAMTAINQIFCEALRVFMGAFDTDEAAEMAHQDVDQAWEGVAQAMTENNTGLKELLQEKLLPQIHEGISGLVRDFKVGR